MACNSTGHGSHQRGLVEELELLQFIPYYAYYINADRGRYLFNVVLTLVLLDAFT